MIVFISVCGTTCENVEDFVICLKEEVVSVCNTDMASKGAFHLSELASLMVHLRAEVCRYSYLTCQIR